MVFMVEGGSGRPMRSLPFGSASSSGPPSAGGMPLGWYGGWVVLTDYPSGVTWPPSPTVYVLTAPSFADGESGYFFSLPFSSSTARMNGGASLNSGTQARTRY